MADRKNDAIMEGVFLFVFACIGAFLLYQGKFNQEKGQDGFFITHIPEVVWKGPIKEKFRVEDTYTFVMNIDGEFKKLSNVATDAYHKNEVGDTISMIVKKEDFSTNKLAIFTVVILLVTVWVSDAWVPFCVSFVVFSGAKWFGAEIPVFFLVFLNTILAHTHSLFHKHQRAVIKEVESDYTSKEVFLFMSFPEDMGESSFFKMIGNVYVHNGRIYKSREDAVVGELKG